MLSDEIDLETNNLCTTEDAFEKFQSVSMYEENEYITLSDIVSPSHNNHDITEILTDSLGNNVPAPVQEKHSAEASTAASVPEENTKGSPQSFRKKMTRKRGRSKKKSNLQSNMNDESSFKSSVVIDHQPSTVDKELSKNEESDDKQQVIATTSDNLNSTEEYVDSSPNKFQSGHKPKKRRGRPPKCTYTLRNINIPIHGEFENETLNKTVVSEGENNISLKSKPPKRKYSKNKDKCTTPKTFNNEVNSDMKQDCNSKKQKSINKKCAALPLKDTNASEQIQSIEDMCDGKSNNVSDDDLEDLPLVALSAKNTNIKGLADTVDNLNLSKKVVTDLHPDKEMKNNDKQIQEEENITLSKLIDSTTLSSDTDVPLKSTDNQEVVTNVEVVREHNAEINTIGKRNLKKTVMSDYEYNIDTIESNPINNDTMDEEPGSSEQILVESSRPVRRKAKKNLQYDEGSDEDPFANLESSDDEPRRRKRGGRPHSDDEYIPDGGRSGNRHKSDLTDTDTNVEEEVLDDVKKNRKKKFRKSNLSSQKSPKKICRQNAENNTSGLNDHIDVELNLETSVIKIDDEKKCEQNNSWGATNEFENFLAKIVQGTDIKIKKAKNIDSTKAPLQIPMIDPTMEKKSLEVSSQTDNIKTKTISVQTNTIYEIPMKDQVALTTEQTQKAIEFLSGIVKTTSELGQLMTEKSEDFIAKKINNTYVTDTFKMDYCVKKSFLLFKLAKHNLIQMEADLSKQYEEFLKENNLIQHREEQKIITATSKTLNSDSDCEIVEEPVKKKAKEKAPFNPKTVFLNKELSIKIAKKPTETPKPKEKINIKGRHTVWINDSVMIKKVKPTQSFLAQDSRNKKPPDTFITIEMVSEFFKTYERQKAVSLCAPYINNIFLPCEKHYICNYFLDTPKSPLEKSYITSSAEVVTYNEVESSETNNTVLLSNLNRTSPDSLLSICTKVLQRMMNLGNTLNSKSHCKDNDVYCINETLQHEHSDVSIEDLNSNGYMCIQIHKSKIFSCVPTLKNLCYKRICQLIYMPNFSENETGKVTANLTEQCDHSTVCENNNILCCTDKSKCNFMKIKTLSSMCLKVLQNHINKSEKVNRLHKVNTLSYIALKKIKKIFYSDFKPIVYNSVCDRSEMNAVKSLSFLCTKIISSKIGSTFQNFDVPGAVVQHYENETSDEISLKSISLQKVMCLMINNNENDSMLNFTIDNVNTVSEDIFFENSEHDIDHFSDEHDYSDDNELVYTNNFQDDAGDETNWVAQVQMQELRSCVGSIKDNCVVSKEDKLEDSVVKIKMEPLDDFAGNTINSTNVKIEPADEHENLLNFTPIDIITKQEDAIVSINAVQRKHSGSYDEDLFETFVSSHKMVTAVTSYDNEEIFTQSAHRIRRQYEPDSDDAIDTFTDTMNLLVPQSEETTRDKLMASSSDEGNCKKISKKKVDRRKPKPKKNNKYHVDPVKEKTAEKIEMLTRKMKEKIRLEEKKRFCSDSEVDDVDLNIRKKNDDKAIDKTLSDAINRLQEKEIQCNNVDSTEHITESQSEDKHDNESTPFFSADEPIELLQCTPSIISAEYRDEPSSYVVDSMTNDVNYINRHGWSCYPIDSKDSKIYQYAYVTLDKLPESFVETYNKFKSITGKTTDFDLEIDKLTNLQSLNRSQTKGNIKRTKNISTNKPKLHTAEGDVFFDDELIPEQYQELSLSEDEGDTMEHNFADNIPQQDSENNFAKNLLMDSDGEEKELKIKEEPKEEVSPRTRSGRVIRPTRRDGEELVKPKPENLMLTADKVMDKDLKLLHAPIEVEFKQEPADVKDEEHKHNTRNANKKVPKSNIVKVRIKDEDASSSEEEKQWFTTKEKLLKRLGKKIDTPSVDDAKRAKIVSEFIEKRNDGNDTTRKRSRPRRRSKKKLLERRKQMKILSKELFGDESHTGKKYQSQAYSKGRRNIRKVLDKKSLARGTVLANMDEFERKRRLSQREAQLREFLGCEEGVNVIVINDELCLEYDFDNKLPLVTVHSFFTKVMKAHQYEGVKFMWDACFESVSATVRGGGGGCILAHCMGLGKTLQVLALLHTVLTHPQLSMRRVLVCCPLSTVLNWVDEINKWIGPVTNKIKVFELSKLKKTYERAYQLEDWYNGGGIFIIGYELFRSLTTLDAVIDCVRPTIINKIRTALLDPGPDIVICDEGHLLKNDSSVLAVAMSRVVTKRRIILTGTPMQNNLREYYCMVNFVKPNLLGTYSEYSNRFENPIMNGQHRDSREEDIKLMKARTHILHKVLEGCLQRQEASVLYPYLPKKHEYTVFISQSKCQWDLYKHYLANYAKGTKQSVLKDFHVLQKIWTHPQVLHSFLTRARGDEKEIKIKAEKIEDDLAQEDLGASEDIKPNPTDTWWLQYVADSNSLDTLESSNKFLVLFQLLDECIALDDKVLIFSTSLYTMDSLEYFLRRIKQWSLGKEYYRLDGSVPAEVRQKWCREFNADNNTTTKLFLISTRAGSLGLNMTAANRVIILDTSWNPAHDIQSIFRVYRFGQKKDCYIYRLVAMGTMEQKIYERSVTKQAIACRVVDEQQIDRHYNMAELSELYRLDEDGCSVAGGLAVGVRDGALLRVAAAAGARLHAVHEHDSLLRGDAETGLPEHERNAAWMQFQQEHSTHHKIQNIELKIPSVHKNDSDQTYIEIKEEPTDQPKKNNLKAKKNRKNVHVEDVMTVLPSTSAQVDMDSPNQEPDMEQETVKKIMNILIKHNFRESKGPIEISELITKVRSVVANIDETGLDNVDPLTASIAKVLIDSEKATLDMKTADLNDLSGKEADIKPALEITVSYNSSSVADLQEDIGSERKKRKPRSDSDEEYVPETNTSRATRKKKKTKALEKQANRKSIETTYADNAPINSVLPNTINCGVQDSILMQAAKSLPSNANVCLEKDTTKNVNVQKTVENNDTNEVSIILSDDEADEPIRVQEKEKVIALPKSLLTNKNFIKIVAHTYLSGNPKLDEDAAVLAAQYSTFKALKEMEATGKEIVSGPIYDIATQVIGVPLLKKLQSIQSNNKDKTVKLFKVIKSMTPLINNEANLSVSLVSSPDEATTSSQIDRTEVNRISKITKSMPKSCKKAKKDNSENSFRIEPREPENVQAAAPVPTEVVPVGMFKGSTSFHLSEPPAHEECILPDDDDVIITDSTPVVTPLSTKRLNSKIVINKITSEPKSPLTISSKKAELTTKTLTPKNKTNEQLTCAPKTPVLPTQLICVSRSATPQTTAKHNTITSNPILQKLLIKRAPSSKATEDPNVTICLDSDEEETIIPTPKPKAKALKSTTKLPTAKPLPSSITNASKSVTNAELPSVKKVTPQNIINKGKTEVRRIYNTGTKKQLVTPKPNDIIRITEEGEMEILNRTENVPSDLIKANVETSKPEKNKPKTKKEKAVQKEKNDNNSISLDVENIDDSDGDDSPLSVIQNAVHIPAGKYDENNKASTSKVPDTIVPIVVKEDTKTTKNTINKPSRITNIEIKKPQVVNSKKKIVLKFPSAPTTQKTEKIIDLTGKNCDLKVTKKTMQVKSKDWDKISGSSKQIIINKTTLLSKKCAALESVDLTKKSNIATTSTKKVASTSTKVTPSGSVKRSASFQESTSKKKPDTKKPLTLQDFDIDDFDDIIELE